MNNLTDIKNALEELGKNIDDIKNQINVLIDKEELENKKNSSIQYTVTKYFTPAQNWTEEFKKTNKWRNGLEFLITNSIAAFNFENVENQNIQIIQNQVDIIDTISKNQLVCLDNSKSYFVINTCIFEDAMYTLLIDVSEENSRLITKVINDNDKIILETVEYENIISKLSVAFLENLT